LDEIGQALKSLEVRLLRPDTVKTLESYGIAVKKDAEHFLSFQQIMKNVDNATRNLSDDSIALNDIMDALGGSWRRNWAQILTQDWDKFDEIRKKSIDSFGYSIAENIKVMETFDKKVQVMKNTFEEFAISLGEAGLMDVLKGIVSGLTSSLEAFQKLSPEIQQTVLVGLSLYGVLKVLGAGFKSMAGFGAAEAVLKIAHSFNLAKVNTEGMVVAQKLLDAATKAKLITDKEAVVIQTALNTGVKATTLSTKTAKVQQEVFSASLKATAASARGLQIALGVLPLVLSTIIGLVISYNAKQKEAKRADQDRITEEKRLAEVRRQNAENNLSNLDQEISRIIDLKEQYMDLSQNVSTNEQSKTQLKSIEEQLKIALSGTNEQLDLQNGKLETNITLINESIKKRAEQLVTESKMSYEAAKQAISKTNDFTRIRGNEENIMPDSFQGTIGEHQVLAGYFEGTLEERIKKIYEIRDKYLEKYKNESSTLRFIYKDMAEYAEAEANAFKEKLTSSQQFIDEYEKALKVQSGDFSVIESPEKKSSNGYIPPPEDKKPKKETEVYTAKINQFQKEEDALSLINYQLERNNILTDMADESNKISLLSERVKLLEQEKKSIEGLVKARESAIRANQKELVSAGVSSRDDINSIVKYKDIEKNNEYRKSLEKLIDETEEWTDANRQAKNELLNINKGIQSTNTSIKDLYKTIVDARISIEEDVLEALKDQYTKDYEAKKEALEKKYDLEIDNLNRIKELNSRNRDEQKFQDDQKERYDELTKLQEKYKKILLDPTASKEHVELEKEIAEKIKEIKEAEIDHNLQLEDNRIDDLIDLKQEEKKRVLSAEEKAYNDYISNASNFNSQLQDVMNRGQQGILAFLMANSKKFMEAGQAQGQALIDGWKEKLGLMSQGEGTLFFTILTSIDNLVSKLRLKGIELGDAFVKSIIEQLTSGKTEINRLISEVGTDTVVALIAIQNLRAMWTAASGDKTAQQNIADTAQQIYQTLPQDVLTQIGYRSGYGADTEKLNEFMNGTTPSTTPSSAKTIEDYGREYTAAKARGDWQAMEAANRAANELRGLGSIVTATADIKKIRGYPVGGIKVGDGLAYLHNDERVLTVQQTKSFDRLVDIIDKLPELRTPIPSFGGLFGFGSNAQSMKTDIRFDGGIHVHVETLDRDIDFEVVGNKIFDTIRNRMAWSGNANIIQKR
jgi:hypothetical protein